MSASITLQPGAELCHLPVLRLASGGELHGGVVAFERQGPVDAPLVIVLGGISADRHVSAFAGVPGPGWWEGIVGPGQAIDTERLRVLAIDWLGGAGSSSGPRADEVYPFVDTADQAVAIAAVLDHLEVPVVHAWVGSSYGGMVGLQFAAKYPQRLQRLCAIGAAHESCVQASAWRAVQRGIVELGIARGCAPTALSLARALAMTTYRSPQELQHRFAGRPALVAGRVRFPVQDWLQARGDEFARRFPPAAFLCLNASIDAHRVDPKSIPVPTWLLGFDSDQLVPIWQLRELAASLPSLQSFREARSWYGHDGFLKEPLAVRALLREVLA
ncbi:MAG: homoserine O-succinyltransferase [Planctomycetes bacterium]|nr:homoserine O-succinyltransferase [Planctomycetota bacterium]